MKTTIHRAQTRGAADHGWLKAHHSFSFAAYQNPERMGFGLLKVLNDDTIAPKMGFGTHPHSDMEIVSIPLAGTLLHKDDQGNEKAIKHGEVQLMSAGTGVYHSEYNGSDSEEVSLLQIWILPEKLSITPRYDQQSFSKEGRKNQWQTVVSPMGTDDAGVKINQKAYFSLTDLDPEKSLTYKIQNPGNGVYLFLMNGELSIANETLNTRDAMALQNLTSFEVVAKNQSSFLVIEVPMN